MSTIVPVPELTVNGRRIADDEPAYVIAEIGHNHQGDLEKAKALIHAAKECGVDAVKLQKRDNRAPLHARVLRLAVRQREQLRRDVRRAPRGARARQERLVRAERATAREEGVAFFATAFDEPSADLLAELDVDAFKFASGDLSNVPFLRYVAGFGKPMLPLDRRRHARGHRPRGRQRSSRERRSSASSSAPPRTRPTSRI